MKRNRFLMKGKARKAGQLLGMVLLFSLSFCWVGASPFTFAESSKTQIQTQTQTQTQSQTDLQSQEHYELRARKQLVLLVPELDDAMWQEMEQNRTAFPSMGELLDNGGVGAVSARTPGKGLEDFYASLGAGAPAGSDKDVYGLNRSEEKSGLSADQLYVRYRGGTPGGARIVTPELAKTEQITTRVGFEAHPGLLGETLKEARVARYAFGNADGERRSRFAVLALTDRSGLVEFGDVGSDMLQKDAGWPFGVRMDGNQLLAAWRAAPADSVVMVEWGDLSRLEEEQAKYSDTKYAERRQGALAELDRFIGGCLAKLTEGEGLWVVSAGNYLGKRMPGTMLPLLYYEKGMGNGLLRSDSTRRPGIVTLYDLSSAILNRYGVEQPPEMLGRPIGLEVLGSSDAWPALRKQLKGIRSVYVTRPRLLLPYAGYEAIVLLAALLFASWTANAAADGSSVKSCGSKRVQFWLRFLLLSLLMGPFAMLLLGWLTAWQPVEPTALVLGFIGLVAAGSVIAVFRPLAAGITIAACTAAALLADGLLGAEGMKRSLLGYDPVVGARFYGIGNEYMGVLLGAVVLAVSWGLQLWGGTGGGGGEDPRTGAGVAAPQQPRAASATARRRQRLSRVAALAAVAGYAGVALYLAAPQLGSEAGGAIAAAVAFGLACRRSLPRLLRRPPGAPPPRPAMLAAPPPGLARSRQPAALRLRAAAVLRLRAAAARRWHALRARLRRRRVAPAPVTRRSRRRASRRGLGALRLIAGTLALMALALTALWFLNAVLTPPAAGASHIGSAMEWLRTGRFDLIEAMIARKLQMNLHLLGVSAWSKVLLAGLLVMLAAVLRPRERQKWQNSHPYLMDGCSAITIGAIVALLFNDSGIVAAGTMIIYAAIPMLLLKLQ